MSPHLDRHLHYVHFRHHWKYRRLAHHRGHHDRLQLDLGPEFRVLVIHAGCGPGSRDELRRL
jgi:hypothetical protein